MILAAALLAGSLLRQEPPQPASYTTKIGGKEVKWSFQAPGVPQYPEPVLQWDGWGFLASHNRNAPKLYKSFQLPEGLDERYKAAHAKVSDATPVWKAKVVVFRESDILDRDESGLYRRRYSTIEPFQIDEITASVARLGALIEIATNGALGLDADVETDKELIQFDRIPGAYPWDERWAADYFGPRVNGPGFVSKDKFVGGPYDSIFYFTGSLSGPGVIDGWINDSPITGFSIADDSRFPAASTADGQMLLAWERHAHTKADHWLAPVGFAPAHDDWALLTADSLTPEQQAKIMTPHAPSPGVLQTIGNLYALGPISGNVTAEIANDPERGGVLLYSEKGLMRAGGMVAPRAKEAPPIDIRKAPFFSFFVKSLAKDPIAITLFTRGQPRAELVLGDDYPARDERDEAKSIRTAVPLAFKADGTWQRIVVDLRGYLKEQPDMIVSGLTVGPPVNSKRFSRTALEKIDYWFDDFAATDTPPTALTPPVPAAQPNANATDELSKALFLAGIGAESRPEDLEAAARLLGDPSGLVKLNAVMAFTRAQSISSVSGLALAARGLNPRIAQMAIRALAHQDNVTAWASVRFFLENATYETSMSEAVRVLGASKEADLAGPISTVIDTRSRTAKMAAAEALGGMPGDKPALIALAFLNQDEPAVRLRVVQTAKLSNASVKQAIVYTAANDPSDEVRTAAYLKLLEAGDAEGWKGLKDDGELVRLFLTDSLANKGSESERPRLRLALSDGSARVRATALRALAKLPKGEPEDMEKLLGDPSPLVQDALLDLASTKAVRLPATRLEELKASPIPRIAAKAKAVGP